MESRSTSEPFDAERNDDIRVRLIVNSIDSIVWEYDLKTLRFTFVSQQAERLLGYPVSRWIDEPTFWQDHMHADDRDWATAFCATHTKNLRGHEFDYRMIAADGRVVWLKDIVSVVTHNGQPVAIRGTMVDITEYKKAAEERDQLEQNRDAFMSAAAHELKTPVSIIQGFAELMLHAGDAFPQRDRALTAIQKGAVRLSSLINDLIDALRLQTAGSIQLDEKNFELTELLEDLVFRLGATSPKHTLRLTVPAVLPLYGDPNRLEQAVTNVIANAIKYSPAGGEVQVRIEPASDRIVIAVEDNGIGIPEDKQPNVFKAFFRAHAGTVNDYGGLGMGLYLSKQIMTLLGGTLEFTSVDQKGSTFRLSLPNQAARNEN